MGLLTSLFASDWQRQQRSLENPSTPLSAPDDWLYDALGAFRASSGVNVNRETALTLHWVWRAVNLLSGDLAKLPLHVYKTGRGGKRRDPRHPAYYLLRRKPNPSMTAFQFRRTLAVHVELEGNGYAYIQRTGDGTPVELIPLQPYRTYPVRVQGQIYYITELITGELRRILPENMLHIKGISYDGLVGYATITKARESLGLAMAMDTWESVFYRNGARPGVVIEHPGKLSPEARKNLRESWERMHSGLENSHRTAILEEGMKVNPFQINARDAQTLGMRNFSGIEVCNWFGVPPHKLGILEGQAYNSLEQENQAYLDSALDTRLVCWEEECDDKLLSESQKRRDSRKVEFDRRCLIRANSAERSDYYHNALTDGWLSRDEVRAEEGFNPIPDGSGRIYFVPLNMAPASSGQDTEESTTPADTQTPGALLEVPDIRQPDHYSCGACAAMCVGRYFGKGPESIEEWKAALGTDVQQSTKPTAIADYLTSLGLVVTAAGDMTLDDLRRFWRAGQPVICPVQDYGPFLPDQATFPYGHYLTVIGAGLGYVFCQDSSADNALKGEGSDAAPGRIMITEEKWLENWHDVDEDGRPYVRFGIAVGTEILPIDAQQGQGGDTPDDESEGPPGEDIEDPPNQPVPVAPGTGPIGPAQGR